MTIADADLCAYLARSDRSFLFLPDFDTFRTRLILRTTNDAWKQEKVPTLAVCRTADTAKEVQRTTGIESVAAENFLSDLEMARPVTQTFTRKKNYVIGHDDNPNGRFDEIVLPCHANVILSDAQDFSADEIAALCEPISQVNGRLILCGDWTAIIRSHPDIEELISDTLGHGLPEVSAGNHPENTWEVGNEMYPHFVPPYYDPPTNDSRPWVTVVKSIWEQGAYYVRSVYPDRTEALHSLADDFAAEWAEHMFLIGGDVTGSGDVTVLPAEWRLSETPEFGQRVRVVGDAVTALITPDEQLPFLDELGPDINRDADPLTVTQSYLVFHAKSDDARFFPADYKLVAKIEAADIDSAVELSQHNGRSWAQNPGITSFTENPRSTQVGDILIEHDVPKRFLGAKGWCLATTNMDPVHVPQNTPVALDHRPTRGPMEREFSPSRPKI
jgi:hypothetical protein